MQLPWGRVSTLQRPFCRAALQRQPAASAMPATTLSRARQLRESSSESGSAHGWGGGRPSRYGGTALLLRLRTTPVGFEPTRGNPIGLAGRRLNCSAKVSLMIGRRSLFVGANSGIRECFQCAITKSGSIEGQAAFCITFVIMRYPGGCAAPGSVPCQCNTRGLLSKLEETPLQTKINVTSKSPVGDISVVTLIRTDTTLDHSHKAEKV